MTANAAELVEVGSIGVGGHFRIPTGPFSEKLRRVEVTGWTYGTVLFSTPSRTRVCLAGTKGKHVVFGGDDPSKRREFDASTKSEVNYPTMVEVVAISEDEFNEATNPVHFRAGDSQASHALGGATTMDSKQAKALIAKHTFALKQVEAAGTDTSKLEVAQKRVDQIVAQAAEAGVDLTAAPVVGEVIKEKAAKASPTPTPTPAKAKAGDKVVTKSATKTTTIDAKKPNLKEQNAQRVAALKAKGLTEKAAKPARVPKADKVLASMNDCLCGCGTETGGKFAPGHDARVKGQLYKVERGEMTFAELPEAVQKLTKFAGRSATAGKDTSDYRLVQAPVKVPGRPEIKLVNLDGTVVAA